MIAPLNTQCKYRKQAMPGTFRLFAIIIVMLVDILLIFEVTERRTSQSNWSISPFSRWLDRSVTRVAFSRDSQSSQSNWSSERRGQTRASMSAMTLRSAIRPARTEGRGLRDKRVVPLSRF